MTTAGTISSYSTISQKAWLITALFAFFHVVGIHAGEPGDSVLRLNEVVVHDRTASRPARIDSAGSVTISAAALRHGQHVLGETDALRFLTSLPGFSTAGDYGSGVSVGGDDISTTLYTIDGATVFHPFHFGGMFSGFNSSHLSTVSVDRHPNPDGTSMRTGAHIQGLTSDYVPSSTTGIANIGMLATGVSVTAPFHGTTVLRASGRTSHINTLYGSLLDYDDTSVNYAFEDANLTLLYQPGTSNSLKFSAYANSDRLRYGDGSMSMDTRLHWGNLAAVASWRHQGSSVHWHQDVEYSKFSSHLHTGMASVLLSLESSVRQFVACAGAEIPASSIHFGYRLEHTCFLPQRPLIYGTWSEASHISESDAWLASLSGGKRWRLGAFQLSAGADVAFYRSCGSTFYTADPSVALSHTAGDTWTLRAAGATQFMHQVGFSDTGFASDFRLPSIRGLPPQRSFGVDFIYRRMPQPWLNITINTFARRVLHSPQYMGGILDILDSTYDPFAAVILTDGFNMGADALVSFSIGAVSGWAGYGFAVCRRKISGRWTSSANEPLHTLKAMAEYTVSSPLKFSISFVLASGRPYTPVEAIYMIGGNVITEYGLLNSARLPSYQRLDLSATYTFPSFHIGSRRIRNYVNLSVVNAYGHRNVEMQYFVYNAAHNTVSLRRVCSLYRFLPSISYTIEF